MRRRSTLSTALIGALLVTVLSGCTASGATDVAPPTTTPPDHMQSGPSAVTEICADLSAPVSLVNNAALAPEGALSYESKRGLYATASSEFVRLLDAAADTDLEEPLEDLEQAAGGLVLDYRSSDDPAKASGNLEKASAAVQVVGQVCSSDDPEWATFGWYGG